MAAPPAGSASTRNWLSLPTMAMRIGGAAPVWACRAPWGAQSCAAASKRRMPDAGVLKRRTADQSQTPSMCGASRASTCSSQSASPWGGSSRGRSVLSMVGGRWQGSGSVSDAMGGSVPVQPGQPPVITLAPPFQAHPVVPGALRQQSLGAADGHLGLGPAAVGVAAVQAALVVQGVDANLPMTQQDQPQALLGGLPVQTIGALELWMQQVQHAADILRLQRLLQFTGAALERRFRRFAATGTKQDGEQDEQEGNRSDGHDQEFPGWL